MKYALYQEVMLLTDIPAKKLAKGDLTTIVEHHTVSDGEDGYSLEAFNVLGDSLAVVTVLESDLAPLRKNEVFNVRSRRAV